MSTIAEHVHSINPTDLPGLEAAIFSAIQSVRDANPGKSIWLVSGKVTSKNPLLTREQNFEQTHKNEEMLVQIAKRYQESHPDRIIFTSGQIMSPELREKIYQSGVDYEQVYGKIIAMWEKIAGSAIDGIYMAKPNGTNYGESQGALAELNASKRRGIRREYQNATASEYLDSTISRLPLRRFASTGRVTAMNR